MRPRLAAGLPFRGQKTLYQHPTPRANRGPLQLMMGLSPEEQERAIREAALVWHLRNNKGASDKQIAERLKYGSVDALRRQLENWGMPNWIAGEESETNRGKKKVRKKSARRARDLSPTNALPPLSNAAELFKERLRGLLKIVEQLEHMNEDLHGKYFDHTTVDTSPVYLSKELLPKELWETLRDQRGLDRGDEGFLDSDAVSMLPGGVARSPSEITATLISVYALAGGRMDLLVEALHPDPPPAGAKTWEEIDLCVDGSKADNDKRDGLKVLARHLATWVRGSEVGPGKPSGLSEADHRFACTITHYRKHGLTDEEIARKESHRKKEDGTSYSVKDITELGDLGLSWS